MKINDNNKYELIDDYLKGGMSQDDADRFRAFMQSDKDLALDTAITSELSEAATFNLVESQLRDTLSNIRKDRVITESLPSSKTSNNGKIAITALLLAGLLYLLLTFFNPFATNQDQEPTFQQYAMVEPLALVSKGQNSNEALLKLEALYNDGSYAESLPYIETYLSTNKHDLDVLLAKGVVLTEMASFREAHIVFATIGGLNPRVNKHMWFDAVAYAKEGKTAQARQILHTILKNEYYNHQYAKQFLARLNS